jgi:nucleoside-diphosphate-sugar epimerase
MTKRRQPRRAVVTGGAGFLGTHLCDRLLDEGVDVVCLDNFVTASPRNVAHLTGRAGRPDRRCRRLAGAPQAGGDGQAVGGMYPSQGGGHASAPHRVVQLHPRRDDGW